MSRKSTPEIPGQLDGFSDYDDDHSAELATTPFEPTEGVEVFLFNGAPIRVVPDEHGEPWFVAADAATILGHRDATTAVRGLRARERATTQKVRTHGGPPLITISEAGLYRLIMRSSSPAAEPFQDWVTEEVLPSIRKTGAYVAAPTADLATLDGIGQLLAGFPAAHRLATENASRAQLAEARADKADQRVERITGGIGMNPSDFRREFLETPQVEFFEHLYARGYLIDQRDSRSFERDGRKVRKNGLDHMKPRAPLGSVYFKLVQDGTFGGRERYSTVVKPGMAVALRDRLVAEGLTAIPNLPEIEAA